MLYAFVAGGHLNLREGEAVIVPAGPAECLVRWLEGLDGMTFKLLDETDLNFKKLGLKSSTKRSNKNLCVRDAYAIRDQAAVTKRTMQLAESNTTPASPPPSNDVPPMPNMPKFPNVSSPPGSSNGNGSPPSAEYPPPPRYFASIPSSGTFGGSTPQAPSPTTPPPGSPLFVTPDGTTYEWNKVPHWNSPPESGEQGVSLSTAHSTFHENFIPKKLETQPIHSQSSGTPQSTGFHGQSSDIPPMPPFQPRIPTDSSTSIPHPISTPTPEFPCTSTLPPSFPGNNSGPTSPMHSMPQNFSANITTAPTYPPKFPSQSSGSTPHLISTSIPPINPMPPYPSPSTPQPLSPIPTYPYPYQFDRRQSIQSTSPTTPDALKASQSLLVYNNSVRRRATPGGSAI